MAVAEIGASNDWEQILNAFDGLSVVQQIINDLLNNKQSVAVQAFRQLIATDAWKNLSNLVSTPSLGIETIGIIGGGEGSFVVGGKGMYGLLTGTTDTGHVYYYESEGVSLGAQEGGVAAIGLYLHNEELKNDWCVEIFSSVAGDVGVGVAIEGFTTVSTGSGFVVLVTTGEELEANFGASYSTWRAVDD